MAVATRTVGYTADGVAGEALVARDDAATGDRPAVLVVPTIMGRTAFEDDRAMRLAALGYVGVSIDLYGLAVRPGSIEDARPHMDALNDDRTALARRLVATWEAVRGFDGVDGARTAAIGFCFGGKCVLDLARTGAGVAAVAAFHGIFDPPPFATADRIGAKVLALHGWDDPLAPPGAVTALAAELTAKGADWELDAYGGTGHGFTNPARPTMYREDADRRSWVRLQQFLSEALE